MKKHCILNGDGAPTWHVCADCLHLYLQKHKQNCNTSLSNVIRIGTLQIYGISRSAAPSHPRSTVHHFMPCGLCLVTCFQMAESFLDYVTFSPSRCLTEQNRVRPGQPLFAVGKPVETEAGGPPNFACRVLSTVQQVPVTLGTVVTVSVAPLKKTSQEGLMLAHGINQSIVVGRVSWSSFGLWSGVATTRNV